MMIDINNSFDLNIPWRFPDGKRYAFTFIALLVFLLVIYGNSYNADWHFDDMSIILNNPNVHLSNLTWPEVKKTFYSDDLKLGKIDRPVAGLTFGLNYYFGGKEVLGYHVVNFLIHYTSSIFLFLFIYHSLNLPILKGRYVNSSYSIALLATFFWATHPIQVLAVTYIVQRLASMAGMFYIISMYLYLKGKTCELAERRALFFFLCVLSGFLAIGTKQNAAMLPASIFLYDLLLFQGLSLKTLKRNIKFLAAPLLVVIILGFMEMDYTSFLNHYNERPFTMMERLITEPRVVLHYISLLFYPIPSRMAFLHDFQISKSLIAPWTTLASILSIIAIMTSALLLARKRPLISFCIIFFFLNHVIESTILPLEILYEHRNYLPSMLFFVPVAIFMVHVLDYFSYRKLIQFTMALGISLLLSANGHTTYTRNEIMETDMLLWLDNVDKFPNVSRAHNNLGKYYYSNGLYSKALDEYTKALRSSGFALLNEAAMYHNNIGSVYFFKKHEPDRAYPHFEKALELVPHMPAPNSSLALILLKRGKLDEAINRLKEAVKVDPFQGGFRVNLGLVYLKAGKFDQAIAEAHEAIKLKSKLKFGPDESKPLQILAEAHRRKRELEKSIHFLERYLSKTPFDIRAIVESIELYSRTQKKEKLNNAIGNLMALAGKKKISKIIEGCLKNPELYPYVPDPNVILPIIREFFLERHNEITEDTEEKL